MCLVKLGRTQIYFINNNSHSVYSKPVDSPVLGSPTGLFCLGKIGLSSDLFQVFPHSSRARQKHSKCLNLIISVTAAELKFSIYLDLDLIYKLVCFLQHLFLLTKHIFQHFPTSLLCSCQTTVANL